jgi:ATP-dependent Clp protease adaptor protein ClpS
MRFLRCADNNIPAPERYGKSLGFLPLMLLLLCSSTFRYATAFYSVTIPYNTMVLRTRATEGLLSTSMYSSFLPSQLPMTRHWVATHRRRCFIMTLASGPAILDRPDVLERTISSPSREASQQDQVKERSARRGDKAWEVRIYNDGMNTREHVARSLVQVTGMAEVRAYQTMMQAHQHGMAVVGRWVYEVAEMYHDALRENGIVCDLVPVEDE